MAMLVDDDVKQLRKGMQKLRHEIERANAVTTCTNLMNKYQIYQMRNTRGLQIPLFAMKTPGARVEMAWGIYDEPEGIERWKIYEGAGQPRKPGTFPMHCMTTPIIEVAKDCQTAKGLWLMIGAVTRPEMANWAAASFAMDFIKEDGEWKIWKYITAIIIFSPFDKGWHKLNHVGTWLEEDYPQRPPEAMQDRPPSHRWIWSPDKLFPTVPPVPLPYETWDESMSCVPPPGKKWQETR